MSEELLRVENLTYSHRGRPPVLRDLYLSLGRGEILGLLGRNGSGKSTLFNAITLDTAGSGRLFWQGRLLPTAERWRHIAYLPQTGLLPGSMRTRQVLKLFCADLVDHLDQTADSLLDAMGNTRVVTLSGGERRYLDFLAVLGLGRPVTILDEPFAGMSPLMAGHMIRLMHSFRDQTAFLVSDHEYATMKEACTRLCLLWGGELRPVRNDAMLRTFGYLA